MGCSLVNHEFGFIFFHTKGFERSRFQHKVADEWKKQEEVAKEETLSTTASEWKVAKFTCFLPAKTGMANRILKNFPTSDNTFHLNNILINFLFVLVYTSLSYIK